MEFNLCLLTKKKVAELGNEIEDSPMDESLMKINFLFSLSPLQMHDSLTFLARYIQTRGSPLPVFGTFGIIQPDSIPIGLAKSHTTATSSVAGKGNLIVITGGAVILGEGRPARCHFLHQDRPQLLR